MKNMKNLQTYIKESLLLEAGTSATRLLTTHSKFGYIIISACRHECSEAENNKRTSDLRRDIKDAGYSFKSVLGGFVEDADTNPHDVTEKSFVVFCKDRKGNTCNFEDLKKFAIEMCKKYDLDCVLVADPNKTPTYYTADGKVDVEFSSNVTINRAMELYFTKLKGTKFSFKEAHIEDWHSVADRTCRHYMGEVF